MLLRSLLKDKIKLNDKSLQSNQENENFYNILKGVKIIWSAIICYSRVPLSIVHMCIDLLSLLIHFLIQAHHGCNSLNKARSGVFGNPGHDGLLPTGHHGLQGGNINNR